MDFATADAGGKACVLFGSVKSWDLWYNPRLPLIKRNDTKIGRQKCRPLFLQKKGKIIDNFKIECCFFGKIYSKGVVEHEKNQRQIH